MVDYKSYFTEFNKIIHEQLEENIRLYYPETRTECPNCYLDTFGAVSRSVSIYRAGGPIPFTNDMPCPYCDGQGYKATENYEDIPARSYTVNKDFISISGINIPKGSHQVICTYTYFPKIMMAKYMIPYSELQGYVTQRYYLAGQPEVNQFKMNPLRYMSSHWTKTNGKS